MNTIKKLVLVLFVVLMLTGCYWRKEVESYEAGVVLDDGVTVSRIVPAGRYDDFGWYADIVVINVSTITTNWEDPSLVTKDKQPVSLRLKLTYNRSRLSDNIEKMFTTYQAEALNDEALIVLVHSRVPSVAKTITTKYTLDEMLGIAEGENATNRQTVESELFQLLSAELLEIGVELQNVALDDIGVDQAFLDALSSKAQAQIAVELAKARTLQLNEQLKQEQAQTEIDLEIAHRQNEVNQTLAEAFENSPEFFELERLKLLKDVIGKGDVVIYVPEGSDIATILGQSGVVPIP